jgi:hypothetical protein
MKRLLLIIALVLILVLTGCGEPVQTVTGPPDAGTAPPSPFTGTPNALPSFATTPPTYSGNITREQAIEIASEAMQPAVVARAAIRAEFRGWYWEVVFDNLNATSEELKPFPFWHDGPPPADARQKPVDPWAGIWQWVMVRIDPESGRITGSGAGQAPKEEAPYMSEAQAVDMARRHVAEFGATLPDDFSWIASAMVDANLQSGAWSIVFWEEGNPDHRLRVSFDAATGEDVAIARG